VTCVDSEERKGSGDDANHSPVAKPKLVIGQ